MWGWITASVVALLGTAFTWYYRSRSVDGGLSALLVQNKSVLQSVNSLLLAMTARANEASRKEQEEAKDVTTAKEASDFLNSSGGSLPAPTTGPSVGSPGVMRVARRVPTSKPINGFARGLGHTDKADCLRPGSVVEGREEMARIGADMPQERC